MPKQKGPVSGNPTFESTIVYSRNDYCRADYMLLQNKRKRNKIKVKQEKHLIKMGNQK